VADTVIAKIFAEEEKTADLYALLREPNHVVLSELEPVLKRTGQYNALCVLYRGRGEDQKLLDVFAKYVLFILSFLYIRYYIMLIIASFAELLMESGRTKTSQSHCHRCSLS
jgi:Vacuolar sorting protein 39 domain 1